ncbi:MAG: ribosome biogenesis GTP-binding protein YihA/YsxC [Pseudomonadales bacterium]
MSQPRGTNSRPAASTDRGSVDRLQVSFLTSAPSLRQCPAADGAEVAFAGRSNAGKSSVLNRLTGSRQTAKVSKTPGRTRLLNFFTVASGGRLVDLPGYGYAKAARSAQKDWQRSVNEYLSERDALAAVVLVTDIRHPNQAFDVDLIDWAVASDMPLLVLLNKTDKLKRNGQIQALHAIERITREMPSVDALLFSAQNGLGGDAAVGWVRRHLGDLGE